MGRWKVKIGKMGSKKEGGKKDRKKVKIKMEGKKEDGK